MTELLFWPLVAGLVLTLIHAWFGLHVLARGVVFVDLSLAQVAEVPIFPLFIVRAGHQRYQIIVHAPIIVARNPRSREVDIATAVVTWCQILEETIAQHWDQWFSLVPTFAWHEKS